MIPNTIELATKRGFIDGTLEASKYDPRLVINDQANKQFVINDIVTELEASKSFFFSVAFITQGGLNELKTQLADLAERGISGRIMTSNYLAFNHPDVYQAMLKIPNVEVRLSSKPGFHAKGYLFEKEAYYSLIMGSSNLTQTAVKLNYEWNLLLNSLESGQVLQQTRDFMEAEWEASEPLTHDWIENYREVYERQQQTTFNPSLVAQDEAPYVLPSTQIMPNSMQKEALKNLTDLRGEGARRGLVISATGTGKTYLSAFDVRQYNPKRMLFIVHREQILSKARNEFHKILGGKREDFGILSGSQKETSARYLFSTIQTISRDGYLNQFEKEQFDYILIDEVHKAGAASYKKVIDYFMPNFLLGMTATPERTDGFDIFGLFDYNVAYEIRLQAALEAEMLTPFHYFGVTDYEKDGVTVEETTDLQFLVADERVDFLLEKIDYYGHHGDTVKGLVFCSQKKEVKDLAEKFTARGLPSAYLTGDHTIEEREAVVRQLEDGELSYIFTVDIFNEGIDIPKVNQVVMLRNTQSNIIFVQQLGRGLRKHASKEFVTVIDFIGNYRNNYMIPMALTGDNSRNKNNLRRDTFEANYISGLTSVNFEEVAKERVYQSIDQAQLDSMVELKKAYTQLKNRLGHVPTLKDFQESQLLEPMIIADKQGTYHNFLAKVEKDIAPIEGDKERYLKFDTREILPGQRLQEVVLLESLLAGKLLEASDLRDLFKEEGLLNDDRTISSVINVLTLTFFTGGTAKNYQGEPLIKVVDQAISFTETFKECIQDDTFNKEFIDILETARLKNATYDNKVPLTLYEKYSRKDVLKLTNWNQEMVSLNIGGYTYRDGEFAIFVTLKKGEDFKGAQVAYEDRFLSPEVITLLSKNKRKATSPEFKVIKNPKDWTFRLFIQKSNDEGADFYYMGEVEPINENIIEIQKDLGEGKVSNLVEYDVRLKQPVKHDLYKYLNA